MKNNTAIIRTAVLAIALINTGLTLAGLNPLPFDSEETENVITMITTTVAALWAWHGDNKALLQSKKKVKEDKSE